MNRLQFSQGVSVKIFFISLSLFALLLWGSNEIYQKKTRFGLLAKFSSPTFSPSEAWDVPPLSAEEQLQVDAILSQPFTYLARGSQAFAFISEDGQYVLKLFKQHKWHPKHILGYIPLPFNPYYKNYLFRQGKQHAVLSSCMAALLHVKEDTGVLFAHLNPRPLSIPPMTLTDKHGKPWVLDLSNSCFLLQKKADLFYPHIQKLMEQGDTEGAKASITSTLELLDRFFSMGVFENNAILRKNFGFIGNEAIQFDIGKFKFDASHKFDRGEIRYVAKNFYRWIGKNYPELLLHFDEQLQRFSPLEK
jgi:hypothetical protein